jgi:hypothetical protein
MPGREWAKYVSFWNPETPTGLREIQFQQFLNRPWFPGGHLV